DDLLFEDATPAPPRPAPAKPAPPPPRAPVRAAPARPAPAPPPPRPAPAKRPATDPAAETVFELGPQEGSRILGDPEQLLAEASVYLRYGKRAQAIENLQAILASQPHHRAALEKLGDAYADDGDATGAVAAWLRAAELARDQGDLDAMRLLRDRVGALDEGAAATLMDPDAADDREVDGGEIEEIDFEAETGGDAPGHVPVSRALAREPEPLDDGAGEDIDIDLDGIDLDPAESSGEEPAPPPAAVAPETTDEIDLDADLGESAPPAEEDTPSPPAADAAR